MKAPSGTILLASLLKSVGVHTQLVLVPKHMYLRIYLDNVPRRYKQEDNYVYLDWTCSTCKFGQIPKEYENKEIIG